MGILCTLLCSLPRCLLTSPFSGLRVHTHSRSILDCTLTVATLEALVETGLPEALEEIDLLGNHIGDQGAEALARGMPQRLKRLRLQSRFGLPTHLGCSLSAAGIASLAAVLPPTLEEFDVRGNLIGNQGADALAKGIPQKLKSLNLRCKCDMLTQLVCSLSASGLVSLVSTLPLTLEEFHFGQNVIEDEGAVALARGMPQQLKRLVLTGRWVR